MTTSSAQIAESARLAIALARAWETNDRPAQQLLLRQVTSEKLTAHVLLSMTAMLVNAVGVAAEALDAEVDDMWQAPLHHHGEQRPDPS